MHMSDALISPSVGGAMLAASLGTTVYCARVAAREADERKVPMMGVLGAFIFAAQMINFAIPGTGSSGHLTGGLLLSILLGPHCAFLTVTSILVVQALFFADGGLLALGCNVTNLALFPCFVAYPLLYRAVAGTNNSRTRVFLGGLLASVVALQLGALGVVLETFLSGRSDLPLPSFLAFMLPIHLVIGLAEGVVTAALVLFLHKAHPEFFADGSETKLDPKKIVIPLILAIVLAAGVFSLFSSAKPDGLEWSLQHVSGTIEESPPGEPTTPSAALIGAGLTLAVLAAVSFSLRRKRTEKHDAND